MNSYIPIPNFIRYKFAQVNTYISIVYIKRPDLNLNILSCFLYHYDKQGDYGNMVLFINKEYLHAQALIN